MQPWRVHEQHLHVVPRVDSHDPVPRGLWLGRGNAELLPDQAIQQSGFTDVGTSHQPDIAAMLGAAHASLTASFSSASDATACSARRLLVSVARSSPASPATSQATVIFCSCAFPCVSTTL